MDKKNIFIESEILRQFRDIDHGFSTRFFSAGERLDSYTLCGIKQVHGTNSVKLSHIEEVQHTFQTEADILISQLSNVALAIRTADCVPLLFFEPIKKAIGAAHAGWRGSAQEVSKKTVHEMKKAYGTKSKNLYVAIGPAIRECCYEVDQSVFEKISQKKCFTQKDNSHWMMSLQELNRLQLLEAGVSGGHIWISSSCTACEKDRFFSYRREKDKAGRQWSFIVLKE